MTMLLVAIGLLIWLEFGVILAVTCCTSGTSKPPVSQFFAIVLLWPLMVVWGVFFAKHLE